eukprot:366031-Chlamydomonas_euryale.AAC.12
MLQQLLVLVCDLAELGLGVRQRLFLALISACRRQGGRARGAESAAWKECCMATASIGASPACGSKHAA